MRRLIFPLLLVCAVALADDPKHKPTLEDALKRAAVWAKHQDMQLIRITSLPHSVSDESAYLAVVEFGTGDVGLFAGGSDPVDDRWILLDKTQLPIVEEALARGARR